MLSGRRALLVFMVCAALNCNVLMHFPVLRILLHTCLEKRNQVMMKAHLTNKWLKSDTRYFSAAPGPLLVLKNRKCLYPCTEVWLDLDTWISSLAYYPLRAEKRKSFKCGFSFWEAFCKGEGKGVKVWPFKLSASNAPRSTLFIHRYAFLHLLLEKR